MLTYPATKSAENHKIDVLPWMATGEKARKSTAVEGLQTNTKPEIRDLNFSSVLP